jgi:hypothetical protein
LVLISFRNPQLWPPTEPFTAEEAERATYHKELERLRQYVSMGEGI